MKKRLVVILLILVLSIFCIFGAFADEMEMDFENESIQLCLDDTDTSDEEKSVYVQEETFSIEEESSEDLMSSELTTTETEEGSSESETSTENLSESETSTEDLSESETSDEIVAEESSESETSEEILEATSAENPNTVEISENSITTKKPNENQCDHDLCHIDAIASTCTEKGVKEYWQCLKCGKYYADAEGNSEIDNIDGWGTEKGSLELAQHKEVVDEAVEPTCMTTGLTEGSHCEVCNKVLVEQTVIDVVDHDYQLGVCSFGCGTINDGFAYVNGAWGYYINNALTNKTGLVYGIRNGEGAWYYVQNGLLCACTGQVRMIGNDGSSWMNVKNGKLDGIIEGVNSQLKQCAVEGFCVEIMAESEQNENLMTDEQ